MRRLTIAALFLFAAAGPASAQTDPGLFVTGAGFAGIERVPHAEIDDQSFPGLEFSDTDLSDTVFGWSVGIGTFVHPAWSVRFEFAVPGKLEEEGHTFDLGGGISIGPRSSRSERAYNGSVLIGHHVPLNSRLSLGLLGGVVFGRIETRSVTEFSFDLLPPVPQIPGVPLPDFPPIRSEARMTSYHAGAGLGLDVDWALADRIVISPQLRAHALGGGLSLRPGVGLRFNF
jgi:opacity protein-like surface antigen